MGSRNKNLFLTTSNTLSHCHTVTFTLNMNKRKYQHLQSSAGFLDRKHAEQMFQRKLKRLSSCTLYKKVLVKNTLKFVQSSQQQDIFFQQEYEEDDLISDVNEILNEMIFPKSFIPLPEDLSLDWPETPVSCLVPDVEIIEDDPHQDFLASIFSDRTNVTITKISDSKRSIAMSDRACAAANYSMNTSSEFNKVKPEISIIPSSSLKILLNDFNNDLDKY